MKDKVSALGTSQERLGTEFLARCQALMRNAVQSAPECSCAMTNWPYLSLATRERKDTRLRMLFTPFTRTFYGSNSCLINLTASLLFRSCLQLRQLALDGACRPVRQASHRIAFIAACNIMFMCGLEFYTPGKGWRQAHMQGRWAILRLMIECGAVDIHVRARVLVRCL